MSPQRAQRDALSQLRAANPVSATELRTTIDEEQVLHAMEAAIAAGESSPRQASAGGPTAAGLAGLRVPRRISWALGTFAAAAAVALVVLLVGGPDGHRRPSFAAAAIVVAEANPRLLVTAPGWSVIDAGEFETGEGEVTFGDGKHQLSVTWYPAREYGGFLRDRSAVSPPRTSRLLGRVATTVHYRDADYATTLSPEGPTFVEVRGGVDSHAEGRAEYEAVLHSLRRVDVDTWLSAMPPNVVRPQARAAAVANMLRGVPLPPGFDAARLEGGDWVLDRYQLAGRVAGAVSCGWVEDWLAANAAGDESRAREAVAAMAGYRRWAMMPILAGGWGGNVGLVANELESGHLDRRAVGEVIRPDGTGYELGPAWAVSLNCTSRYWRRPLRK